MTHILDTILAAKYKQVQENQSLYPVKLLEKSIFFNTTAVSLCKYLQRPDSSGIIAEFKRASPSKGMINDFASVERVSTGYMQAGASALSILTDKAFFKGSNQDLESARKFNFCPILRKDFIIDEYQIIEAKAIGADVVLLIASALSATECSKLTDFAHSLGLEVLLEVHDLNELQTYLPTNPDLIGINNRNLKTFELDVQLSFTLINHIPKSMIAISESGIDHPQTVFELRKAGYQGFLIGECFMKEADPGQACTSFINALKSMN